MDTPTAIVIVAVVAAIALTAAALLTARSRIGVLPVAAAQEGSSPWAGLSEKAKQSRMFGWILVLLLYLVAVFCVLQGLNAAIVKHHWSQWQAAFGSALSDPAEITLYSRFWIAIAVALVVIAFWTQRRLRRRAG
jgi:hypothetical protein